MLGYTPAVALSGGECCTYSCKRTSLRMYRVDKALPMYCTLPSITYYQYIQISRAWTDLLIDSLESGHRNKYTSLIIKILRLHSYIHNSFLWRALIKYNFEKRSRMVEDRSRVQESELKHFKKSNLGLSRKCWKQFYSQPINPREIVGTYDMILLSY